MQELEHTRTKIIHYTKLKKKKEKGKKIGNFTFK